MHRSETGICPKYVPCRFLPQGEHATMVGSTASGVPFADPNLFLVNEQYLFYIHS